MATIVYRSLSRVADVYIRTADVGPVRCAELVRACETLAIASCDAKFAEPIDGRVFSMRDVLPWRAVPVVGRDRLRSGLSTRSRDKRLGERKATPVQDLHVKRSAAHVVAKTASHASAASARVTGRE